jgi:hypothetical protein
MSKTQIGMVRIPGTGVSVTRLVFGCARIFSGSEAKASAKLIETALACGIRHFDTAPSYSNGQSEEMLGQVLAGVSDATVTTKVGLPHDDRPPSRLGTVYRLVLRPVLSQFPGLKAGLLQTLSAGRRGPEAAAVADPVDRRHVGRDEILRELDGSLARLRRARVDVLLVHEPDRLELAPEAVAVFADLQQQGVIGAYGRAWDKVIDTTPPPFGQIVQSRYRWDASTSPATAGTARFFHGVLRHVSADRQEQQTPTERLRDAVNRHPASTIIFSASHPRQIREIVQQVIRQ